MNFDLSGGVYYGELTTQGREHLRARSICPDCTRPAKDCEWLCEGKLYENSAYWMIIPQVSGGYAGGPLYIVVKCPLHNKE